MSWLPVLVSFMFSSIFLTFLSVLVENYYDDKCFHDYLQATASAADVCRARCFDDGMSRRQRLAACWLAGWLAGLDVQRLSYICYQGMGA